MGGSPTACRDRRCRCPTRRPRSSWWWHARSISTTGGSQTRTLSSRCLSASPARAASASKAGRAPTLLGPEGGGQLFPLSLSLSPSPFSVHLTCLVSAFGRGGPPSSTGSHLGDGGVPFPQCRAGGRCFPSPFLLPQHGCSPRSACLPAAANSLSVPFGSEGTPGPQHIVAARTPPPLPPPHTCALTFLGWDFERPRAPWGLFHGPFSLGPRTDISCPRGLARWMLLHMTPSGVDRPPF